MVGAMLDITDRKKVESELEDHRNNLEELVEIRTIDLEKEKVKAQSADLMKSAFLATMSHELRTPMNSIIGFTGIILKEFAGPINAEQKKQLSMVLNSSQHLLGLINDVLDISKIEAGELKVSLYPFNYVSTLKKTIEFLMPQASKKELVITSEIADRIITLKSDERRVEQVLLNLLSNAIKFSTNGTIQVKVVIIDNLVVTQVIDQGIGISKKDLNSLFIPFIQIETGLNRSHEGSGLGLSICKSLIEKLGGTINVLSIKGEGSNFTFTLPLDYDDKV
jgi:signal transduction histidine kinase